MILGGPFERLPSSLAPDNPFCVSTRPRLLGFLGYHSSQLIAICVFQGQARSDCSSVRIHLRLYNLPRAIPSYLPYLPHVGYCTQPGNTNMDRSRVPPVLLLRAWHPWSFYSVLTRPFVDFDVGLRIHLPTFLLSCWLYLLG